MAEKHFRNCNLCEAICGIEITHENGEILRIEGDKADPFSRGHICPKAVALKDIYEDKDRLRNPVRRTADGWEEITWDEAFDEIAEKIGDVQTRFGRDAVAVFQGNPSVHNLGTMLNRFSIDPSRQSASIEEFWKIMGRGKGNFDKAVKGVTSRYSRTRRRLAGWREVTRPAGTGPPRPGPGRAGQSASRGSPEKPHCRG